jgi:hypothetical protein
MTRAIGSLDRCYPLMRFFVRVRHGTSCAGTFRISPGWPSTDWMQHPHSLAGFAGALPFIAHEAAATPLALDFMAHCGLPGASELRVYRTVQEAEALALELMANGQNLPTILAPCPVSKGAWSASRFA